MNQETAEEKAAREALENETAEEKLAREKKEAEALENETEASKNLKASLKSIIGDTITHIIQEDDKGEEVEVAIADLELDQEMYVNILTNRIDQIEEEAKKDKIDKSKVSEFAQRLLEIDQNGGDISGLIASKVNTLDPLDALDLEKPVDQKKAIYMRLAAGGQHSDPDISRLIKAYETEGILKETAETSEAELRTAVENQSKAVEAQADEDKKKRAGILKRYKKELRENMNQFEMNDSLKDQVVKKATRLGDKGQFEIDDLYFKLKSDPVKAAKMALFLLDEDEFMKQVGSGVKKKTQLKTASKLKLIRKGTAGTTTKKNTKSNIGEGGDEIDFNKLKQKTF